MRIGVDFDNSIVKYDELFYEVALAKKLIPKHIPRTKEGIRNFLREKGNENLWTGLQGQVYGPEMHRSMIFEGVLEFFKFCAKNNLTVFIISHKTRYPFIGQKYDLHRFARRWIKENILERVPISEKNIFFELTKKEKAERIKIQKCDYFIDDLPEFLLEDYFPAETQRILFDPNSSYMGKELPRFGSWNNIKNLFKNILYDYPFNKFPIKTLRSLTNKSQKWVGRINKIKSGKNNKVYIVNFKDGEKYVLKMYYACVNDKRDRFKSEMAFLDFAHQNGIKNVPKIIAADKRKRAAIFQHIDGRDFKKNDVDADAINEAMNFFKQINKYRNSLSAKRIGTASEACFSIDEHINLVKKRLEKLLTIRVKTNVDKRCYDFTKRLSSTLDSCISSIEKTGKSNDISLHRKLSSGEICISPSDFGFHNAIMGNNGKIYFHDFEYAGWDDPAKTICDFFCQPEIPVDFKYFSSFVKSVSSWQNGYNFAENVKMIFPIYQIKWCCIMMNEFLIDGLERRNFSTGVIDKESRKKLQLEKAISLLEKIKFISE